MRSKWLAPELNNQKQPLPTFFKVISGKLRTPNSNKLALPVFQGLRGARKLKQGDLYLYVGNGVCAQVEAIEISRNNVLYFNAIPSNGIYEIDMSNSVPNDNSIYNVSNKRVKHNLDSTYLWHCRLAHISKKRIEKLQHDGLLKSTDDESFDQCVSCLSGKMTRKSFPHRPERATDLLGIIHTDVCGPLRHVSRKDASYFITFTDDYSRYGYIYLLKHKHEVFETFKVFKNEVENQLGKTIKALRSDRGGEYISQEFKDYLKACGIVQQLTPPYTPQHNGVSERRNRTLLDMVRSMMNLTTLPLSFWDYALESVARILNMVPTKKVDKTPYELWFGKVPNLSYLKVWGCETLVKRDMPNKLQQRSVKCIFIGYPKETMGYYFYFPPENKIVVARYAEFFEKNLLSQEVSGRTRELEEIQDEDTSPSEITSEIPMEVEGFEPPEEEEAPVRRSEKPHRAPNRLCLNIEVEEHSLGDLNEPANYKAAMLDQESNNWLDAMDTKMQSMKDNQVWRLVNFLKMEETFSLVADIRAIRILIAIAAFYDYKIWQIDVKTAFLNGYLDEDIYMVQPEGFIDPKHPRKVCKLQRSIYGLKQASRSWNKRFDEEIKRLDLNKTQGASTPGENPGEPYWTAMKTILKYLRNTKDMFLVYGGNPEAELRVDYYCDAGFETDRDDTKSQTRYVFIFNGGVVDWKSSKQSTIAMSAIEAEYIAASKAGMEAVWIRKFISGLGILPTINEPIKVFCDNSVALHFANEPGVQRGARHYHRKYHYVRECIKLGKIKFIKVHTDDNLADPFMKALSNKKLTQHARSMGLCLASSFM
ncbi:retrotransposon protein, putative, ty1-copia subclass [Tanacetum coccineum]